MSKPVVQFVGADGNVFNLLGIASRALKQVGQGDKVDEMHSRVLQSGSYDESLRIMGEYVDPWGSDEDSDAEWDEHWAEMDSARDDEDY